MRSEQSDESLNRNKINLFGGGRHARRTEESVSGGDGRERRILHSIPSICERAVSDIGGVGMLARTCAYERGRDTGTLPPDSVRKASIALENFMLVPAMDFTLQLMAEELYAHFGLDAEEQKPIEVTIRKLEP